jgi:predicted peroxiredoxin
MKKTISLLVITIISLFFVSSLEAQNTKPIKNKKLVILITSSNINEAGMGIALAQSARKEGTEVTIILGANTIYYAAKKGVQEFFPPTNKYPRQMLKDFIAAGGTVYLYALYTDFRGLKTENLIKGVKIVKSIKILNKLFEEGVKSLSF